MILREDFNTILGKFDKESKKKSEFIHRTVPFFDRINSSSILEGLIYGFKEELCTKGTEITSEGKQGDKVFWIAEGVCRVQKTINFGTVRSKGVELPLNL